MTRETGRRLAAMDDASAALRTGVLANFDTKVNTPPPFGGGFAYPSADAFFPAESDCDVYVRRPSRGGAGHGFPLIVHCHLRWDFVWQRPQQIFSRLAARHRVLFVEDPMPGDGPPRLELTQPQDGVVRVVPHLPPGLASTDAQCDAVLPLLHDALESHPLLSGRFDAPVQWF
jgi:hypothetical protein